MNKYLAFYNNMKKYIKITFKVLLTLGMVVLGYLWMPIGIMFIIPIYMMWDCKFIK